MVETETSNPIRYRLDASRSRFTVQAFAEGLLSAFGHNPVLAVYGFGGEARFVPDTLESASLLVLVSVNSLSVISGGSDKDRADIERAVREDVLEVQRFPEIVFISKGVAAQPVTEGQYRVKIEGELSLHGITRIVPIEAQVTLSDNTLRAQGEFTLRQSDYDIKRVSALGGTLKAKDEVKLTFDIAAHP